MATTIETEELDPYLTVGRNRYIRVNVSCQ